MDYTYSKSSIASANNYHDLSGLQSIKKEDNEEGALKKVAQQFESLFIHELLKNMRKANQVFEEGSLFNDSSSNTFREMYDQQLSVHLSSGRGLGLADAIFKQLNRQYLQPESVDVKPNVQVQSYQEKPIDAAVTMGSAVDIPKPSDAGEVLPVNPIFDAPEEFVETILPYAEKIAEKLSLNPLLFVAQAALETGWGKFISRDDAGGSSHNLFNIKAYGNWSGDSVQIETTEYKDGLIQKERANFRKYDDFEQSFSDYYQFLTQNPRYQNALGLQQNERQFIEGIHQAGYATDPNYTDKVMKIYRNLIAERQAESSGEAQ